MQPPPEDRLPSTTSARPLCQWCKEEVPLAEAGRGRLDESDLEGLERTWRGRGCLDCGETGHLGRVPVYEAMPIRSREM